MKKGIIGVFCIVLVLGSCGCIEMVEPPQTVHIIAPEKIHISGAEEIRISGIDGIYDYRDGLTQEIWISGIDNIIYADPKDIVRVSGIRNEVRK